MKCVSIRTCCPSLNWNMRIASSSPVSRKTSDVILTFIQCNTRKGFIYCQDIKTVKNRNKKKSQLNRLFMTKAIFNNHKIQFTKKTYSKIKQCVAYRGGGEIINENQPAFEIIELNTLLTWFSSRSNLEKKKLNPDQIIEKTTRVQIRRNLLLFFFLDQVSKNTNSEPTVKKIPLLFSSIYNCCIITLWFFLSINT